MTERPNIVRKALEARSLMEQQLVDPHYLTEVVGDFVVQMDGMYAQGGSVADRGRAISAKWRSSLRVGEVYAVSAEMMHIVEQAASELPDDYVAEHHHLHAEHGFLWLPRNIDEPDQGGMPLPPTSLLTWHHGQGTTHRDADGRLTGRARAVAGIEVNLWWRTPSGMVVPVGSDFLPYGLPALGWRSYGFDGPREILNPEQRLSNASRFVLALQMLMRQELPAMDRWPVPRSDVRTLRRQQLPTGPVNVIDLRRRAYHANPDAEGSGRHMTVRTIVRGHWARYWVGPEHPQHPGDVDEKVAIYLYRQPHVRGPEGAPLVVREHVNVVRR